MAVMLFAMLLGSMNYKLSLGYILVFLLCGMGLAAMMHSFRNLNGLLVSAGRVDAVFAGETLNFRICLQNLSHLPRINIALEDAEGNQPTTSIATQSSNCLTYQLLTHQRGIVRPGRIKIYTRYPLGLFYAWTWVNLDVHGLVYPRPFPRELPFPASSNETGDGSGAPAGVGSDDFAGIREYHPGDPMRHLHWKSLARGGDLMTREFSAETSAVQWLDWRQTPASHFEEQLSILSRWSLDAHRLGQAWGLRLPDQTLAPNQGDGHLKDSLQALATSDTQGDTKGNTNP